MVKKLIQRYLPDPKSIRDNHYLRFLGSALHTPNLWHLNRRSVASAFFIGIFCALLPIPFQMIVAASMAILFRCNLPVSVSLVWLTNPITIPAVFYFTYKIGCYILQVPVTESSLEFSLDGIGNELVRIWKPLYLGSIISGVVAGSFCYLFIRLYWRWNIIYNWRKRCPHKRLFPPKKPLSPSTTNK
ncbi:MAG: DUF2062 domain-containing protein [Candidatus Endonucleobacter bathymodioli]|uniref:DUF2062 domain-containing protein n=1 Tax=Candidatus Endonucleibacter bathymodioli TaxID=539814 RepID=A0AA90SXT7_9GAMM|nr:DUF2062 domain-containing protein [Candidatus Endonucleobacter bathymodioli]